MAKKLTAFEWFLTIPNITVRAKAVRAMHRRQLMFSTLSDAIKGGIVWERSKEGARYWKNKYEHFKSLEPKLSYWQKNKTNIVLIGTALIISIISVSVFVFIIVNFFEGVYKNYL